MRTCKVGESFSFAVGGRTFQVKRLRREVYHLRDAAILSRSRFGTFQEIREDVASLQETGALPGGDKGRW